jgi:hypothetical protein
VAGRLIVEHLGDETLVYDTERNQAHALSGLGAAEFLAAESEVSRRDVLRKLALAGAAAAGTGALVKTIVAPTPAQAQTLFCSGVGELPVPCAGGIFCVQAGDTCCGNSFFCGAGTFCSDCPGQDPGCAADPLYCCGTTACRVGESACCNGACQDNSNTACGPTCQNCTTTGQCCNAGACGGCNGTSDRDLKGHLAPVGPQDVLTSLGL